MRAHALFLLALLAACAPPPDDPSVGGADDAFSTCSNPYTRKKVYRFPEKPGNWVPDVMVGAIRYDVWNAEDEGAFWDAGSQTWFELPNVLYKILPQWFPRAPFYTTLANGTFHGAAEKQAVADREIDFAYGRGIDYFAFLYSRFVTRDYLSGAYRPYETLGNLQSHWRSGYSLDAFHKSTRCNRPRFALIVQADVIGAYVNDWNGSVDPAVAWGHVVADIVAQYQRPNVHTTRNGNPILFMFDGFRWKSVWHDDATVARQRLDQLRRAFVEAGLPTPFLVTLDGYPDRGALSVSELGFDAVSSYASASPTQGGYVEVPFDSARAGQAWYRNELARRGVQMIPPVVTGWDSRPLTPFGRAPWSWYSHATPPEIVAQLNEAIAYVKANPTLNQANSVLIYAWNELAEGGFLVPTLAEGSARLDAIAAARRLAIPAQVPVLPPVVAPVVQGIASWCDADEYGVWIEGASFDPDMYLETRPAAITGDDEILYRYDPPLFLAPDQILVCFALVEERIAYDGEGIRVTLVNPSRPSASTTLLLRRGDDY